MSSPLTLDGDYDVNGKVLILPIVGKGKCKIDLRNEMNIFLILSVQLTHQ